MRVPATTIDARQINEDISPFNPPLPLFLRERKRCMQLAACTQQQYHTKSSLSKKMLAVTGFNEDGSFNRVDGPFSHSYHKTLFESPIVTHTQLHPQVPYERETLIA